MSDLQKKNDELIDALAELAQHFVSAMERESYVASEEEWFRRIVSLLPPEKRPDTQEKLQATLATLYPGRRT